MDFLVFISEQWLLVSILLVLIYVFAWREKMKGGKSISAHEATRLINSNSAVLLDLRDTAEYKAGHIVDAINIPHNKLVERIGELEPHKDKLVLLADKMGQHAGNAGRTLREKGFDVRRLDGGMAEWLNQSLPVVKK
ncbi:MAG: rhodanese-like domain-containing protein [Exilibacterium sp.]